MKIDFSILESYVKEIDYENLLKEFKMTKPELEYYIRLWTENETLSQNRTITLNKWMALLHNSGKDRRLLEIDWSEIKQEFKLWKTFWKNRDAKTILFDFALSLFFLSLSSFDVGSDSKLASSYLRGTNYTQLV